MFSDYKILRGKNDQKIILPNSVAVTSNTEDTKIIENMCTCKKLLFSSF